MEQLLGRFFEALERRFNQEFPRHIVKVSQVKGSFYVLIKKPRGKILGENLKHLFDDVKYISENKYRKFSNQSNRLRYNFFPYFKLVCCYRNNHYHCLVVRHDYQCEFYR